MKFKNAILRQGLQLPVLAVAGTSAICIAWVVYRLIVGAQVRQAYLAWNLFLAWLPLVFAILAMERFAQQGTIRDRKLAALFTAWVLFFPNAPYIFTDLVHLIPSEHRFWSELMLVLLCALTGFVAGFLSLQLMHRLVAKLWGRWAGWGFVMAASCLSAFGVYLGRFARLNSWNVLTHPLRVLEGASQAALNIATQWQDTKFLILFSLFLMLGYVLLFALAGRADESAALRGRADEQTATG